MFHLSMMIVSLIILSASALAQQRFVAHLNSIQEVPATASSGSGSCQIVLNAAETQITVNCTYANLTSNVVASHIHGNAAPGINAPVLFNLTNTGGTSGTISNTIAVTAAQVASMRSHLFYVNVHTANFTGGEVRGQIKQVHTQFDNDGDGRTDIRVFRSSATAVYVLNSINNTVSTYLYNGASLNSSNTDFDGDGRTDLLHLTASGNNLLWRIAQSSNNTVRSVQWGLNLTTETALPADYDGDGRSDIAVYRRPEGVWYIIPSSTNQPTAQYWGTASTTAPDIPMLGDFDGDGINDLTVLRGSTSGLQWFSRSSRNNNQLLVGYWGGGVSAPGGIFITPTAVVDIDADGKQDRMVYVDPDTGTTGDPITYYIQRSSDNSTFGLPFGLDSDAKFYGDYDGDGRTDIVARRLINNQLVWFIYQSSNGQIRIVYFGTTGDAFAPETSDALEEIQIQ